VFETEDEAATAIEELVATGFDPNNISVLMRSGEGVTRVPVDQEDRVPISAGIGGAVGAALGAAGATLVATGIVVAPSLGLVAAGPIVAALEGALAGGVGGSLAGAVAGVGNWKPKADFPHDDLERGAIVVAILAKPRRKRMATAALSAASGKRVRTFVAEKLDDVQDAIR
jgi:hypothetical protein